MNTNASSPDKQDSIKWLSVIGLLSISIVGFYYFAEHFLLRVVALLAFAGIAAWIAFQTEKGRFAWGFIRESQLEVRKVVWPTREETMQTTLIVMGMVVVMSIVILLLDSILSWLVRLLTGQGG